MLTKKPTFADYSHMVIQLGDFDNKRRCISKKKTNLRRFSEKPNVFSKIFFCYKDQQLCKAERPLRKICFSHQNIRVLKQILAVGKKFAIFNHTSEAVQNH